MSCGALFTLPIPGYESLLFFCDRPANHQGGHFGMPRNGMLPTTPGRIDLELWIPIQAAAAALGVGQGVVYRQVYNGNLPCAIVGGRRRVRLADWQALHDRAATTSHEVTEERRQRALRAAQARADAADDKASR